MVRQRVVEQTRWLGIHRTGMDRARVPLAVNIVDELLEALSFALGMFWEILWALILGFFLSAVVQAVVSKRGMRRLLPDDSPRSIAIACGLGAASSLLLRPRRARSLAVPQKCQ